ncbi:MAG TPA: ShlB/FhaC/HecB family hemolysin secretion/activation protein [Nitrospirales bacterium]
MIAVLTCLLPTFAWSQVALPPQLPPPFPQEPPPFPEKAPRPAPPTPILPAPPPPGKREPSPLLRVFVKKIIVLGSTVFSEAELATVTAPYTNRELSAEDIEALRQALTLYYVNRGYVTSGAIIPDQSVKDGELLVQVIEGKLSRIDIEGTKWFFPSYLRKRIELGAGPPVNVNTLQDRLQLLQLDPRITRLNAELRPGITRGDSVLNVRVAEADPINAWVELNNFVSPSVGEDHFITTLAHQNFTGHGDVLSVQYGRSEGINPELNVRYILPLTRYDTTISFEFRKNDFKVVEDPFESLDIQSQSNIVGISVRQPVYRTLNKEFGIGITGEYLENKLFLGGEPTDQFLAGAPSGVSRVSALRFFQDWVNRSGQQVLSAYSRFSVGLDVLGATGKNYNVANSQDSKFFSWLFQTQWARRFEPWKIQVLARGTVQLSNAHLFPLEQISVGGRYSVRGYRENTLVQDNAILLSLETRVPILRSALGEDIVLLAPFADFGRGTNTNAPSADPDSLGSVGMGLIWNIMAGSRFEVYWGQQLNHIPSPGRTVQDSGVHLQLVLQLF